MTIRSRRAARAAVATIAAIGLLAGCGSAAEKAEEGPGGSAGPAESPLEDVNLVVADGPGQAGGSIRYGLNGESDGWNPTNSRWSPAGLQVAKSIYDTLAAYDEDLGWQPNLAEAFEPNDDYSTWKIKLREDVTFHNGSPVDGDAVADAMNAIAASPLTMQPFEPVESITASGPLEVTVEMDTHWVNFPYAMTTQIGVIPDPAWLATGDTREPIGTGAFRFVSWEPGRKLVVQRNENWWREGLPYLDQVEFIPFPDELSRSNALQNGELDIMQVTTGAGIAKMKDLARDTGEVQVVNDPRGETNEVFVMLNTKQPPLDDPDARRALALATDAQGYIDALGEGQYILATGPFAPSSRYYTESGHPGYDVDAARALVQQVKDRHGGAFSLTLYAATGGGATADGTQLIQSMWADAGVDVTVETIDLTQLIASVVAGNYQATLWQQFDSPHPLGDSIWWHPNASNPLGEFALNFARNENPEIGRLLDHARETTDVAEETADYQQVSVLMAQDLPYLWLYHSQISIAASTKLVNIVDYQLPNGTKGLALHGGAHPLYQVWVKD
jgi:ABC-type transport system substrate-binding protein